MKHITTLGIDLAKNVFQLHGTDSKGKRVLSKRLTRGKLLEFIAQLKPCLIGVEACGSAHYWAREFMKLGHSVKLMSSQFVKPYIKEGYKNDTNDAAGIAEAVTRPKMKFVAIKTIEQQDTLMLHRARELMVKQRTAQSNQIRGLLAEYGISIPKGLTHIGKLPSILEEGTKEGRLTEQAKTVFTQLYDHFKLIDEQVNQYEKQIIQSVKESPACQQIMEIEGIGPITASAAVASIGDVRVFKKGRELSAWMGLVPRQSSSGGKERLLGISKRGDKYLRKLFIHGARSVLKVCDNKTDKRSEWIKDKKARCGHNKAAVALANKNVRIVWAMLTSGEDYRKAA
jgi:transposase